MSGVLLMLTKDNVTIGIEWRFGPDWPEQRCGAKTRRGTACQCPANKKNGRCRLHGGASTGAKTQEGRARISAANLRHGKFTKDKLEKRRANAAKGRDQRGLPKPDINTGFMGILGTGGSSKHGIPFQTRACQHGQGR